MIQEIFIIENEEEIINKLKPYFKNNKEMVLKSMHAKDLADHLLDYPALVIINEDSLGKKCVKEICKLIKGSDENSSTPTIVVSSDISYEHEIELLKDEVEFCMKNPISYESLYYIIKNFVKLIVINRGISPLTKLPR